MGGTQLINMGESVGRLSTMDTCDDDAFPIDLAGKQYMNLGAGDASIATVDECRQACCDMKEACHIYQFSETPSRPPTKCWLGRSNSFAKDPSHNYISRGRDLSGWNLKVSLSRYIFASIDNFEINRIGQASEPYILAI